jgi:tetratricopeptide (TPR) repeat protein
MARAAVRAKQAQKAQAQAAVTPSRKQRKHASGGNPNQDLFFMRLRRKQKWVFLALAIIFAVSFVALGVGSGSGGGLEQIYQGLLGGGGDAVAKAKDEIKTDPAKGYKALADAYVTKNDLTDAIAALNSYLALKKGKTDSNAWAQLGGYEKQQGDTFAQQYQQVLQATQLQSPGSIFQPTGALGTQLGTNPIDQYYSTKNQNLSTPLYQQAIAGYNSSLTAFQNAAKYATAANRPAALLGVFSAAQLAGNTKVALRALQRYVDATPNSPNLKQIEAQCKQLGGSCVPKNK